MRYYVEFEVIDSQKTDSIQSRYFDTERQAYNWYKKNIDYVDSNEVIVWLMRATFDENDELCDIYNGINITNKGLRK